MKDPNERFEALIADPETSVKFDFLLEQAQAAGCKNTGEAVIWLKAQPQTFDHIALIDALEYAFETGDGS